MSSELQRQVSALRSKHIQSQPLHEGRPSLFLSASEAAAIDVSTIYETAVQGLNTLSQYDDRFDEFMETIMHPSSVEVQRELKTKEENKVIDAGITKLLNLLALFIFEPSCQVVLEYLIRRYRIHELNAHALLRCAIVTHDTKFFARVVQLSTLDSSVWEFMSHVKVSGVPLARGAIVNRCMKDNAFLDVLIESVKSAVKLSDKAHFNDPSSLVYKGADRAVSFFTATVVEMAEMRPLHDVQLRSILPYLTEGLGTASSSLISQQYARSCSMIIAQLSRKTNMSKALLKAISLSLSQAFLAFGQDDLEQNTVHLDVLTAMLILSQQNKLKIGLQFIKNIFEDTGVFCEKGVSGTVAASRSAFMSLLMQVGKNFDVSPFVSCLVHAATNGLLKSVNAEDGAVRKSKGGADEEAADATLEDKAALSRVLQLVLAAAQSSGQLNDNNVLNTVADKVLRFASSPNNNLAIKFDPLLQLVRFASLRFPVQFNICVEQAVEAAQCSAIKPTLGVDSEGEAETASTAEQSPKYVSLMAFLTAALVHDPGFVGNGISGHGGAEGSSSLLLSLCSSIPQVRSRALHAYSQIEFPSALEGDEEENADQAELSHNMRGVSVEATRLLLDTDSSVCAAAWRVSVLQRLVHPQWGAIAADNCVEGATAMWSAVHRALRHWSGRIVGAAAAESTGTVAASAAAVRKCCAAFGAVLDALFTDAAVMRALVDMTSRAASSESAGAGVGEGELVRVLLSCAAGQLAAAALDRASAAGTAHVLAVLSLSEEPLLAVRRQAFDALQKLRAHGSSMSSLFAPSVTSATKKSKKGSLAAAAVTVAQPITSAAEMDEVLAKAVATNLQSGSAAWAIAAEVAAAAQTELRRSLESRYAVPSSSFSSSSALSSSTAIKVSEEGHFSPLRYAALLCNVLLRAATDEFGCDASECVSSCDSLVEEIMRASVVYVQPAAANEGSNRSGDQLKQLVPQVLSACASFFALGNCMPHASVRTALGHVLSSPLLQPLLGQALSAAVAACGDAEGESAVARSLQVLSGFALQQPSSSTSSSSSLSSSAATGDSVQASLVLYAVGHGEVHASARVRALLCMGSSLRAGAATAVAGGASGKQRLLSAEDVAVVLSCILAGVTQPSAAVKATAEGQAEETVTDAGVLSSAAVRRAALSLATRLQTASEGALLANVSASGAFKAFAAMCHCSTDQFSQGVGQICAALTSSSDFILSDSSASGDAAPSAVTSALKGIFAADGVARALLLWTAAECSGWARPNAAWPVLAAVAVHSPAQSGSAHRGEAMPTWAWVPVRALLLRAEKAGEVGAAATCLARALVQCLAPYVKNALDVRGGSGDSSSSDKDFGELIQWAANCVYSGEVGSTGESPPVRDLRDGLLQLLAGLPAVAAGSLQASSPAKYVDLLFERLLALCAGRAGDRRALAALVGVAVRVPPATPVTCMRAGLDDFSNKLKVMTDAALESGLTDHDSDDDDEGGGDSAAASALSQPMGLSVHLHELSCLLENLVPSFVTCTVAHDAAVVRAAAQQEPLGQLAGQLMDVLGTLSTSRALRSQRQRLATTTRYAQALLVDAAAHCLHFITAASAATAASSVVAKSVKKNKPRSASEDDPAGSSFPAARVEEDVRLLLVVLGADGAEGASAGAAGSTASSGSHSLTAGALALLKELLRLQPAAALPSLQLLGALVAGAAGSTRDDAAIGSGNKALAVARRGASFHLHTGNAGMVEQMLRIFTACAMGGGALAKGSFSMSLIQDLMQAVCAQFQPPLYAVDTAGPVAAPAQQHQQRMRCIALAIRAVLSESGTIVTGSSSPQEIQQHLAQQREGTVTQISVVSSSLLSAATALLVHAVVAFNANTSSVGGGAAAAASSEQTQAQADADVGSSLLLLSKASHRRANREIRSSPAEEFFQQAVEVLVTGGGLRSSHSSSRSGAVTQVRALCGLLSSAHKSLESALGSTAAAGAAAAAALATGETVDLDKAAAYYQSVVRHAQQAQQPEDRRGLLVAVATLQLQCVSQVLENKQFHRTLLALAEEGAAQSAVDSSGSGSKSRAVQKHFLEFADTVLQLLAYATSVEQGCASGGGSSSVLLILGDSLGTTRSGGNSGSGSARRLDSMSLGRFVSQWCADALRSLQCLLDTPSLVTILQELVAHGSLAVRQSALGMLSDRLETLSLSEVRSQHELELFLDLNVHLRKVVQEEFAPALQAAVAVNATDSAAQHPRTAKKSRKSGAAMVAAAAATVSDEQVRLAQQLSSRTALAQSAVMCIDVLARFLGGNGGLGGFTATALWQQQLGDTLSETVHLSATLWDVVSAGAGQATATASMKLLGSVYLCCGTLCGAVAGVKALAALGTLMNSMLNAMEEQQAVLGARLRRRSDGEEDDDGDEERDGESSATSEAAVRLLLIRSVVAAITQLSANVTQFFHPYIKRTLLSTLHLGALQRLGHVPGWGGLREAVDGMLQDAKHCRSTVVTLVPARLSVPALLDSCPAIIAMAVDMEEEESSAGRAGPAIVSHFTGLMSELWRHLDRPTVLAHLHSLTALALLLLDYRREVYVKQQQLAAAGRGVDLSSCMASLRRMALRGEDVEAEDEDDEDENENELGAAAGAADVEDTGEGSDSGSGNGAAAVESIVAQAVVELCLKLTESELRGFMRELGDWKDATVVSGRKRRSRSGSDDDGESEDSEVESESESSSASGALPSGARTARAVSYFALVAALSAKLKSIFVPTFAFVWHDAVQRLKTFSAVGEAAALGLRAVMQVGAHQSGDGGDADAEVASSGKKSSSKKKRKSAAAEQEQQPRRTAATTEELAGYWQSATDTGMQVQLAQHVLAAVRLCCEHDSAGFVDETRFEDMMPAVVAMHPLLPQCFGLVHHTQRLLLPPPSTAAATATIGQASASAAAASAADAQYLAFCKRFVARCASALAVSVTDHSALWKPLNHKVLLLSRDKRKCVRIASVHTLQHLFSCVGEEYLQLLPECLPFLSELLEDESNEVTAATGAAVRFIEELSGEKLDEYLM